MTLPDDLDASPTLARFFGRDEHCAVGECSVDADGDGHGPDAFDAAGAWNFCCGSPVSWQICVLSLIMGVLVPAIAWLTQSALLLLLSLVAILGLVMTFWWRFDDRHAPKNGGLYQRH
jgi:hypothetical protein